MRQIRFGRSDKLVSAIALGTWAHGGAKTVGRREVGWAGHDDAHARSALVRAFELGISHWDTADVYGDGRAERLIGGAWSDVPRDEVFLASKVGWDPGPFEHAYDPRWIRQRAERSLDYLETDWIDLYYLHHCSFGPQNRFLEPAVEELERLRSEGKIRLLGLSDWSCKKLARCARIMNPDVVQAYRNVVDDAYETSGLKSWVEKHDAGVAFFSPLKHGLLLGKYDKPMQFGSGDMRNGIPAFRDARALARLRAIRREVESEHSSHPQPVLHALTGYLLADSPSASVLVGQRTPQQAEAASTLGTPLSESEADWVRHAYA
ncbi:MAG: aldo/keto reductase [Acidobacteriota bacterium]|nr:aldo/keto reductase [Acidobacteriota bacterium]